MKAKHRVRGRARGGICKLKKTKEGENGGGWWIAGCGYRRRRRRCEWLPVLMFVLMWIFTPAVFWPMIRELYGVGRGRIVESDAQVIRLVRRWMIFDWLRVVA